MPELSIITQNLNGNLCDRNIKRYITQYPADIYAFQELRRGKCNVIDYEFGLETSDFKINYTGNEEAKRIWEDAFPWIEFKSGYWMELNIEFDNRKIVILNFHNSCRYSSELRYVLLKRLDELQNKNVILLGDFNAAYGYQSTNIVEENEIFLTILSDEKGYIELCSPEEKENPHYTYLHKRRSGEIELKKLDHIFMSPCMYEKLGKSPDICYIDEVNYNFDEYKECAKISTDHSGIRLTFSFKDQEI